MGLETMGVAGLPFWKRRFESRGKLSDFRPLPEGRREGRTASAPGSGYHSGDV